MSEHLERLKRHGRPWQVVESFDFHADFSFPLIKCYGAKETMERIEKKLNEHPAIEAAMIGDPIGKKAHFNLITAVTKGSALLSILDGDQGKVIAAGDDRNDLSMFAVAHVSIVMETAPQELLLQADIIAPAASRCGIIEALEMATA